MDDLWGEIMRKCLERAKELMDKETAQTAETVEAVQKLIETAISISRNRYESPIGPGATIHLKET